MVQDLLVREFMISANNNITMLQLTAEQCSPPGLPHIHVVAGAVSSIVTLVTSLANGPFGAVSKYNHKQDNNRTKLVRYELWNVKARFR